MGSPTRDALGPAPARVPRRARPSRGCAPSASLCTWPPRPPPAGRSSSLLAAAPADQAEGVPARRSLSERSRLFLPLQDVRGSGLPSHEPSSAPSWPADHRRSPLARPGSKCRGHVGQPEKRERATHNAPPNPSCPVSEGEKDSGFSDGSSECLSAMEQTDLEDPAHLALPPGLARSQKARGGLTPLYLIENVILEQTLGMSPTSPFLTWSNQCPLESARSSAAHLVLLQEPLAPLKPILSSQKPSAKDVCFPTLGTYPRITAHPGWQAEEVPSPAAELSRHKRFYVGEARPSPEAKDSCKTSASPQTSALVCPEAPAQLTLSCAGLHPGGGRTAVKGARRLRGHSLARQRCLQNTVEILRRSGLLGITLRTKELLRQNSRTQRELAQLREEAQLLCEAVQSNDAWAWVRLQDAIGLSAAPCPSSKGGGARTHLGQQPNVATQPTAPLRPCPRELLSSSGQALGPGPTLP